MPWNTFDDKSTLLQVMAWCLQATSHYQTQCWPWSMSPYGITRLQWVDGCQEKNAPMIFNFACKLLCTIFVINFALQLGPASSGKTSLVQLLAQLSGHTLDILPMNSAMDTTELLGGFEQVRGFSYFAFFVLFSCISTYFCCSLCWCVLFYVSSLQLGTLMLKNMSYRQTSNINAQ